MEYPVSEQPPTPQKAAPSGGSKMDKLAALCKRRGYRQPLPIAERMDHDRGFATGRPRPSDDGLRLEPAFVLEEEPGPLAAGVFFTAGQRCRTHCRMAASSRSRACRAGRCRD